VSSAGTSSSAAEPKVAVVADEASNSLIVSASSSMLATIARLVEQIDQPMADVTELRIFRLRNADPSELADQLSQLFPGSGSSTGQAQAALRVDGPPTPPEFGGGPPGSGLGEAAEDSGSERKKKQSQVLTVADMRTSCLLVRAASTVMSQIARLIEQLDASPGRKEVVSVYELRNTDPQDVSQVLQDLFNRTSVSRNNSTRTSLLGQNNPLAARQTQQQSSATTGISGSGNSSGMGNQGQSGASGSSQ
jgi:type II secretory pathway component GspD/PulD (secretin)